MEREQFLNRIRAGTNQAFTRDLDNYFKDYAGPYDENSADEYVHFFNNNPKDLAENAHQGSAHREALIKNGLLQVNSPLW